MLRVSVEKYVEGRQETVFSVLVGVVRCAADLLPQAAKDGLGRSGIHIDGMADAGAHDAPFSR